MRYILAPTASRLLHTLHPRQLTTYATFNTLYNAVNMIPGKEQRKANRMGDAYSRKESSAVLEEVCLDFDAPARALKDRVESLFLGAIASATDLVKEAYAEKEEINGHVFLGDNIGMVSLVDSISKGSHQL